MYCRACYPLSPTPPPEGGGAFLPSPLQGEGPGERVFSLNLTAVTLVRGNQNKINARGYGHDHSKLWAVR